MGILDRIRKACLNNDVKGDIDEFSKLFLICIKEIQDKFDIDCGGLKLDCFGGEIGLSDILILRNYMLMNISTDSKGNTKYCILSEGYHLSFTHMMKMNTLWYIENSMSRDQICCLNVQLKKVIEELRGEDVFVVLPKDVVDLGD